LVAASFSSPEHSRRADSIRLVDNTSAGSCYERGMLRRTSSRANVCALALAGLTACGPATRPKSAAPPAEDRPKLDITDPWVDPEADRPHGIVRTPDARDAALRNPVAKPIVIRGATILTASGARHDGGVIVLDGGRITYVGAGPGETPSGATVIDGSGKFVTPGIIDAHSHLGVYPSPSANAHGDGNEAVSPNTAYARAEYGYWPQDPQITRALAGGVTTALILPGSANLFGGHGFTVQMRTGATTDEVAFPGAPATIKMACGENPKRVYGDKGGPQTRMAEYAAFRAAFTEAAAYAARVKAYGRLREMWLRKKARAAELDAAHAAAGKTGTVEPIAAPEPVLQDLKNETLAAVLRGEILVQIHCYRANEIAELVEIADEFGFQIRSFHHALEAYKVRDLLVEHGIAINTWADWWGFKLEAFDGIPENAGLFTESGGRVTIHSDSPIGTQRLNQEAAKALASARAQGIAITDDQALRWITANPAWVLGIDDVTGTLEVGKRADVVLWSGDPFSVYSKAELVVMGGEVAYDRARGREASDYELGNSAGQRVRKETK
jgi:imidazolonepropionase-like amidohydrolase